MAFAGRRALFLYKKTEPRGLGLLNIQIFELLLKRCDFHSPTEGIFYLTGLDAGDGVVQLLAEFAYLQQRIGKSLLIQLIFCNPTSTIFIP